MFDFHLEFVEGRDGVGSHMLRRRRRTVGKDRAAKGRGSVVGIASMSDFDDENNKLAVVDLA